jgi:SAM-dependent methyltransferase
VEGKTFRYTGTRIGRQFICEAADLSGILPSSYDFVLSSNSLEHVANPLKALATWIDVLRPGGCLLLVLPRKESNFDHRREVTPFEHLLDDLRNGTTEHDLTHLEDILRLHDYSRDPPAVDAATMRKRSASNFENRCLHHHVFDAELIKRLFDHFRLACVMQSSTATDHIGLAMKPARPPFPLAAE